AEERRTQLVAITGIGAEKPNGIEDAKHEERSNTLSTLPEAKGSENELREREDLREEIRDLALRALANDPLNAGAYRALGEVISGADQVRLLMQKAFEHSRRESIAVFWLLNDSYYRNDFKATLHYSDILLRTRPELGTYIYSYLSLLSAEPEGRSLLADRLASEPTWRKQFFQVFPRASKNADATLLVMTTLRDSGKPVLDKELAPYLNFLVSINRIDAAYNARLQFLAADQLEKIELLTNGRFERKPSGLPFDWKIDPGVNAIADFVPLGKKSTENAFHIKFSDGRIQFPQLSQVLFLPPGRYRLEGNLRGSISGKRGLRWQIRCASGAQKILGETEMLLGQSPQWRVFAFDAEVPEPSECAGEILRLIHDSRSASEELLSGEVWFSNLRLTHLHPVTALWSPVQTAEKGAFGMRSASDRAK
ncbi:MAG TPA: hypothetical protein VNR65_12695, partial [Geobacterales bacterium]|nr:hypothetical protein [Geobacterales bacterium]